MIVDSLLKRNIIVTLERGDSMLFEDAYEDFKIFANRQQKKQSYKVFAYNFNANILSFFKGYKLELIKTQDILDWQDYILSKNFCNNHNKNLFAMINSFFKFCHVKYNFDLSIMYGVFPFPLKVEKKKNDFYTFKEFKRFIKYVDNPVYKCFFELMFYCGTRPGEAMALTFNDIEGEYISINKTIDEHGKREVGSPKTLSSNRNILIPKHLKKELLSLLKLYCSNNLELFIFGGVKPLSPTTLNRYKIKACFKANLRPITLHQFRHSHATYLLNKGVDIHFIRDRLGHSKVSTTLDVYTHSKNGQEKRVLKLLSFPRFNVFAYNFKTILKRNPF